MRQYSSKAHCDFSCNCSIAVESVSPHASEITNGMYVQYTVLLLGYKQHLLEYANAYKSGYEHMAAAD